MTKKFPIPNLTQENWDKLQDALSSIHNSVKGITDVITKCDNYCSLESLSPDEKVIYGYLEKIDIELGLIDLYLGRTYTVDEAVERLKEMTLNK